MVEMTVCPGCGVSHPAAQVTCPYCGRTKWGTILPGLIFGLICAGLFFFAAPVISSGVFRSVVKWSTGILGGLSLLGAFILLLDAVKYKISPLPRPAQEPGTTDATHPESASVPVADLEPKAVRPQEPTETGIQPVKALPAQEPERVPAKKQEPQVKPRATPVQSGPAEFIRMVPIVEGKLRRFGFINMQIKGREIGKLENPRAGWFSHPKIMLVFKDKKVMASTEGENVFVNDQPLLKPRELTHGDRITLGKDKDRAEYQYQAHPRLAKAARLDEERTRGIKRRPPDLSCDEKPIRRLQEQWSVAEGQMYFRKYQGGTQVHWKKLDEVVFIPDTGIVQAGGPMQAAMQGASLGIEAAQSAFQSEQLSDREAIFPYPAYVVQFRSRGQVLGKLTGVDRTACLLIDQAIECYAPMDLVRFDAR